MATVQERNRQISSTDPIRRAIGKFFSRQPRYDWFNANAANQQLRSVQGNASQIGQNLFNALSSAGRANATSAQRRAEGAASQAKSVGRGAFSALSSAGQPGVEASQRQADSAMANADNFGQGIFKALSSAGQAGATSAQRQADTARDQANSAASLGKGIFDALSSAGQPGVEASQKQANAAMAAAGNLGQGMFDALSSAGQPGAEAAQQQANAAQQQVSSINQAATDGLKEAFGHLSLRDQTAFDNYNKAKPATTTFADRYAPSTVDSRRDKESLENPDAVTSDMKDLLRFYDAAESNPMLMANGLAYNSLGFGTGDADTRGFDPMISAWRGAEQGNKVNGIEGLAPLWARYNASTGMAYGPGGEEQRNWEIVPGGGIYIDPSKDAVFEADQRYTDAPQYQLVRDATTGSWAYSVPTSNSLRAPDETYENQEYIAPFRTNVLGQIIDEGDNPEQRKAAAIELVNNNYKYGAAPGQQLLSLYTPEQYIESIKNAAVPETRNALLQFFTPTIDTSNENLTFARRGLGEGYDYDKLDEMAINQGLRQRVDVDSLSDDEITALADLVDELAASGRGGFDAADDGFYIVVNPGQPTADYISRITGDYQNGLHPEYADFNVYNGLATTDADVLRGYLGL
jgi:hypothetical protein